MIHKKGKAALTEVFLILPAVFWGSIVAGCCASASCASSNPKVDEGAGCLVHGGLGCFGIGAAQTAFTFGVSYD